MTYPTLGTAMDDTSGFSDFFHNEYPRLVGALTLYSADQFLAEELAQETFARAFSRWRHVRSLSSPSAWVYKVGFNLVRSSWRRRAIERRHWTQLQEGPEAAPTVDQVLSVRQSVASLPKRARTALVLRYYLDLSVRETAEVMGCPEGTVKTLCSRAVSSLRRKVDRTI